MMKKNSAGLIVGEFINTRSGLSILLLLSARVRETEEISIYVIN
jgi:ABC-type nitrate/sulfonate/bicarbonate transport system permease component